jgi:cytoskeleton protein RodZ
MESIGEELRTFREEKGYSLDQVARDTHITKRFLEALEQESFSSLPGESYVVGFLRSYSDYLGLNAEEMVTLYRNLKLQEQPAPMSQLLERPRLSGLGIALISVLVVAVFVIGGFIIYSTSQRPLDQALENATPSSAVLPSAKL